MTTQNENNKPSTEPESLQGANDQKDIKNREEYKDTPESGWETGQGISNAQFVKKEDEGLNETERGPSDAGIGMTEIKQKQKEGELKNEPFGGIKGTGGSEAGT
ncbi:MAG TPA: hypothetical protein VD908_11920 [Cytophagales bacterium]|nr:hypothetical protein [Cytophagales bacterium]